MNPWGEVVRAMIKPIADVISEFIPDPDKAKQLEADIQLKLLTMRASDIAAARDVIVAEAQGESWLQRSWRPITMLIFTALIVAHWLGYTAANLPNDQVLALLDIVQIGLGGYVVGRSLEKGVKAWKETP